MKDWLEQNPNGSKNAFEEYFKALTPDVIKVCNIMNNFAATPLLMRHFFGRNIKISWLQLYVPPSLVFNECIWLTDVTSKRYLSRKRRMVRITRTRRWRS
jgi:hypothetical protein